MKIKNEVCNTAKKLKQNKTDTKYLFNNVENVNITEGNNEILGNVADDVGEIKGNVSTIKDDVGEIKEEIKRYSAADLFTPVRDESQAQIPVLADDTFNTAIPYEEQESLRGFHRVWDNSRENFGILITTDAMTPELKAGYICFIITDTIVKEGDMIAVCVDGKLQVRRISKSDLSFTLVPTNISKYPSKTYSKKDKRVRILGVVSAFIGKP